MPPPVVSELMRAPTTPLLLIPRESDAAVADSYSTITDDTAFTQDVTPRVRDLARGFNANPVI